jgi:hypothetical protein
MADLIAELEGVVWRRRAASSLETVLRANQGAADYLIEHHAEIAAAVRDAETLRRVKAMRDEWERDEREHLVTFGQHLPASVICLVEKLDTAMRAGEGQG